jgi:hypothetical protein
MIMTKVNGSNVTFGTDGRPISFDSDITCIDSYKSRGDSPGVEIYFKVKQVAVDLATAERIALEILSIVATCRARQNERSISEILTVAPPTDTPI